jgi:hypothetical protein
MCRTAVDITVPHNIIIPCHTNKCAGTVITLYKNNMRTSIVTNELPFKPFPLQVTMKIHGIFK